MTEPSEQGGDPACWAHLVEEPTEVGTASADLAPLLHAAGDGVHWTLAGAGDLNANLVRLEPGHRMGAHVNDEVDVLVVVLDGAGQAMVDGATVALHAHVVAHVPKGAAREIVAGEAGLAYLTVHRRRGGGLAIGR